MSAISKINVNGTNYDLLGLPVGTIFCSALPQINSGVHLLDGGYIATNGIYASFCSLVEDLSSTYDILCTEQEYTQDLSDTGNCGRFVLDSVNHTLRLPTITTFIQGLSDITTLGTAIEAGLPNITGTFGGTVCIGARGTIGAFYDDSSSPGSYGTTGAQSGYTSKYSFDASLSNSIYGNSNTVQPSSVKYPYYIVLATMKNTDIEVDIDEVASDIGLIQNSVNSLATRVSNLETNYGFYKFTNTTVSSSSSPSGTIQITTKGRPVFCSITGDINPTTNGAWLNIYLKRIQNGQSTTISQQIVQSASNSMNVPFGINYLDIVGEGTYTYEASFTIGSGTINLAESGALQAPNFVVYEI